MLYLGWGLVDGVIFKTNEYLKTLILIHKIFFGISIIKIIKYNQKLYNFSMKIQVISDVHLEFYENPKICNFIKSITPVLCIVGDLCCCDPTGFKKIKQFFDKITSMFELIIWVPGNHEYYRNSCSDKRGSVQGIDMQNSKFCSTYKNIKYLRNGRVEYLYGKTLYRFIGSTLWTCIPLQKAKEVENYMSDYAMIYVWSNKTKKCRKITCKDVNSWYKRNIAYIKKEIDNSKKLKNQKNKKYNNIKTIILTHHKPFYDKRIINRDVSSLAYESDQTNIMNSKHVDAWLYGHTHKHFRGKIGGCIVASNPRGYPREKTGLKSGYYIIV